jgi:hypothetical protein
VFPNGLFLNASRVIEGLLGDVDEEPDRIEGFQELRFVEEELEEEPVAEARRRGCGCGIGIGSGCVCCCGCSSGALPAGRGGVAELEDEVLEKPGTDSESTIVRDAIGCLLHGRDPGE